MTIEELISDHEEVEDLDVVLITKNRVCEIYEGEDINFIDEDTLGLEVKKYTYATRFFEGIIVRIMDIEC
jgi:hypothetical protein